MEARTVIQDSIFDYSKPILLIQSDGWYRLTFLSLSVFRVTIYRLLMFIYQAFSSSNRIKDLILDNKLITDNELTSVDINRLITQYSSAV